MKKPRFLSPGFHYVYSAVTIRLPKGYHFAFLHYFQQYEKKKKPLIYKGFSRADEQTRTADLLITNGLYPFFYLCVILKNP